MFAQQVAAVPGAPDTTPESGSEFEWRSARSAARRGARARARVRLRGLSLWTRRSIVPLRGQRGRRRGPIVTASTSALCVQWLPVLVQVWPVWANGRRCSRADRTGPGPDWTRTRPRAQSAPATRASRVQVQGAIAERHHLREQALLSLHTHPFTLQQLRGRSTEHM